MGLSLVLVLDAGDFAVLVDELGDACLAEDLDAVGLCLCEVLELLHLSVGDGHTRELGTATVGTGLRVTAETRDLAEVEIEAVHEPVDGLAGLAGEHLDEVVAGKVTSRLLGVLEEGLGGIWDALLGLGGSAGAVDTGSCLGRVTAEEGLSHGAKRK